MANQPTPVLILRPKTSLNIDRRAWVRFPKNKAVGCHSASAPDNGGLDTAWLGKVRDISRRGIALSLRQRFEPGTALTVELSDSPKVLRHLLVHVVHATAEWNGRWIMGCTLDCPLSPAELEIFLQEEHAEQ